jgi:HSP20 family protein
MADEKLDPVKEFSNIRDSVSKVIGQGIQAVTGGIYLLIDIYETENTLVIRTSPIDGIVSESFEVAVEEDMLTIQGETQDTEDIPAATYLQRERRFGKFTRTIRLPRPVVAESAEASFSKKGILTITLPKIEDNRPQVIDITSAE